MLDFTTQNKLGVLQGLVVEQSVQFRPLCRGVAVLVLHGDAVDGKGSATLEPGFYPVGVHVTLRKRELLKARCFRQGARKDKKNFGKKREGWTVPALLTRKNTRFFIIIKL